MSDCKHEWIVYSTALVDAVIMVECSKCKQRGSVGRQHSTDEDWSQAFHAPSNPYPLRDGLYPFVKTGA